MLKQKMRNIPLSRDEGQCAVVVCGVRKFNKLPTLPFTTRPWLKPVTLHYRQGNFVSQRGSASVPIQGWAIRKKKKQKATIKKQKTTILDFLIHVAGLTHQLHKRTSGKNFHTVHHVESRENIKVLYFSVTRKNNNNLLNMCFCNATKMKFSWTSKIISAIIPVKSMVKQCHHSPVCQQQSNKYENLAVSTTG